MYLWAKHFHYCGKAKQSVKEKRKGRKKVGRSLVERVGDEKRGKKIKEWEQDQIMCWEKGTHRHCLLLWFSYFVSFYISTSGPTIHLFSCFLLFYTFSFLLLFFSIRCTVETLIQTHTQPYKVWLPHRPYQKHVDRRSSEVFPLLESNQAPHSSVLHTDTDAPCSLYITLCARTRRGRQMFCDLVF